MGSAALVLSVPGHTPGSIALHRSDSGLLLTGDTIAEHEGAQSSDPSPTTAKAWRSLERLAAMDLDVACFGHGKPIIGAAHHALRRATDPLG